MNALRPHFLGMTVEELVTRLRVGIIAVDQDGIVRWTNPALVNLLGITSERVIDAPITRLLSRASGEAVKAAFAHRTKGDATPYELAGRRLSDNVRVKVRVLPSPIFNDGGNFLGSCSVVLDRSEIDRLTEERDQALVQIVQALTTTIEKRDAYTAGHQRRVASLSFEIGRRLGLSDVKLGGLYLGALIHDVGKIAIPVEILTKPAALSEAELSIVQSHAAVGEDILKNIKFPWPIAVMIGQHHERLDGSGYPRGLKGDEIIQEARIIAVADVLEAMSEHRPYRPSLKIDAAIAQL